MGSSTNYLCVLISDTCWQINHPLQLFFLKNIQQQQQQKAKTMMETNVLFTLLLAFFTAGQSQG